MRVGVGGMLTGAGDNGSAADQLPLQCPVHSFVCSSQEFAQVHRSEAFMVQPCTRGKVYIAAEPSGCG